jgi:signal peptidase I
MDIALKLRSDKKSWFLFTLLCAVYCTINLLLPRLALDSMISSYVITPLLWGLVILLTLRLPGYRAAGKLKTRSGIIQIGLMIGICQIIFYTIGGLFSSFGNSPSSFTALGIFTNLVLVVATLAGMELSRAWLINHLGKRIFVGLAGISVFYTVLSLSLSQLTGIKADVSTLSFINSSFLPSLMENILATLLALLAGPWASIAYRGVIMAFWWFCPILPDLSWSLKGLIGLAVPILGMVLVWNSYMARTRRGKARRSNEGLQAGWIITAVVSVMIVWFAVGIFPVHPVLVGSGSMSPFMNTGDVAIIAKVKSDSIKVGDVIEFRKSQEVNIVHRVIALKDKTGANVIITRGDANGAPDADPVIPANVVGKVVFNIPKVGWLAVAVKGLIPQ